MMLDEKNDGITHINIYSKGRTELGRFLSNFTYAPFNHPEDGKFNSIEAYWYWLSSKNDKLRLTSGFYAKKLGRELGGKDWIDTEDFKQKIKLAIIIKLENSTFLNDFLDSKLPFYHYYVYGGKIVEPDKGQWIIDFFEQLRNEYSFSGSGWNHLKVDPRRS